jgi:hypothetical protein
MHSLNTWLQPGDSTGMNDQPFQRVCISAARGKPLETAAVMRAANTGLKPGVNETSSKMTTT